MTFELKVEEQLVLWLLWYEVSENEHICWCCGYGMKFKNNAFVVMMVMEWSLKMNTSVGAVVVMVWNFQMNNSVVAVVIV